MRRRLGVGTHYESMKLAAFHLQSDFLELRGTVSQWSVELLSGWLKSWRALRCLLRCKCLLRERAIRQGEGAVLQLRRSRPPSQETAVSDVRAGTREDKICFPPVWTSLKKSKNSLESPSSAPVAWQGPSLSDHSLRARMWRLPEGPSPARGLSFLAACPGPVRSAHSPLGGSGQRTQTDIHPNHGLRGPAAHCHSTDAAAQRWELPSTTGTGKRKAWATEAEHNSGQGQTKRQGLTSSQERPCGRDQPAPSQIGMRFLTRWAQVRRAPGFQCRVLGHSE